ncbi:MAG: MotA/TolQ/ExbB proton channel family protein [Comamonadaceae bacterium]|nr:MotA/TolQ/ExbB proton channel family protein [Comamonadaceae bacterium]
MKQEILASGISVAMLTTAFGLLIAIPCLIGFYIINNKGESVIDEIGAQGVEAFQYSLLHSSMKRNRNARFQAQSKEAR